MKALRQQQQVGKSKKVRRIPLWPEIDIARQNSGAESQPISRIAFHVQAGVEFVDPMHVTHLEAQSNYTAIYCYNNRRILISKTLKEIASLFPKHFLRIHQSYLVNPQCIQSYHRQDQEVKLENGTLLPVSRTGKTVMQEFVKSITN